MAGIPLNPACGWTERRAGSREYLHHLADAHPITLRKIGFANASALAGLSRYPLRRIHSACVEREELDALRASDADARSGLGHVVGPGRTGDPGWTGG